jgi:hypothetical protein
MSRSFGFPFIKSMIYSIDSSETMDSSPKILELQLVISQTQRIHLELATDSPHSFIAHQIASNWSLCSWTMGPPKCKGAH